MTCRDVARLTNARDQGRLGDVCKLTPAGSEARKQMHGHGDDELVQLSNRSWIQLTVTVDWMSFLTSPSVGLVPRALSTSPTWDTCNMEVVLIK